MDAAHDRLVVVREDHSGPGEAVNTICAVSKSPFALRKPGNTCRRVCTSPVSSRGPLTTGSSSRAPLDGCKSPCFLPAGLSDGSSTVLASGGDFYASPRLNADACKLAYVTWNHPNMPWDDVELWVADVAADGTVSGQRKVIQYIYRYWKRVWV